MREYPIVVVGAGAAGLVVAIGAAKAGKKVLLIENGNYGGDCTNFGCIPSKSLIASAETAYHLRTFRKLGLAASMENFNTDGTLNRAREIVFSVRSHEEPEALSQKGVETLTGLARFVNTHHLEIETKIGKKVEVCGDQIVIATGSSPSLPAVDGLGNTPFLTNETIFDLKEIPKSLIILGGGPIGCELGQAFHRLGSEVFLLHKHSKILNKEEPETQDLIQTQFVNEGIHLYTNCKTANVVYQDGAFSVEIEDIGSGQRRQTEAQQLLTATGRTPNTARLNLEAAGVAYTRKGIQVDSYGRTTQKHIWAIGDVNGEALFTHAAENQARAVLFSLLTGTWIKSKIHKQPVPRVTYTDPEGASIGMQEKEAAEHYGASSIAVYFLPLAKVDRAITAGRTEGFVKVITKKWSSRILGASIVSPHAGEMICQIATAMYGKIPLRKLAHVIHPYPCYGLAIRQTADMWLSQTVLPSLRNFLLFYKRFM